MGQKIYPAIGIGEGGVMMEAHIGIFKVSWKEKKKHVMKVDFV